MRFPFFMRQQYTPSKEKDNHHAATTDTTRGAVAA